MPDMSVTEETSQLERLPLKAVAPANIRVMSVTPERSGASSALYSMLEAPRNAEFMVSHSMFPHCSMDCSFAALVLSPDRAIDPKSPYILTVWLPGEGYTCDFEPETLSNVVSSSHITV